MKKHPIVTTILMFVFAALLAVGAYLDYRKNAGVDVPLDASSLGFFSSPRFGITFQYAPETMMIEEDGDTVHIRYKTGNAHSGDTITVFGKERRDDLDVAILKAVYDGQMPEGCDLSVARRRGFRVKGADLVTATVVNRGSDNPQCALYAERDGTGFFFMDDNAPDLFYFIRSSTPFGGISGTIHWQTTLSVKKVS